MITPIKELSQEYLAETYNIVISSNKDSIEAFEGVDKDKLYVYTFGGVIILYKGNRRQFVPNNMAEVVFRNAFN